MHNSGCFKKGQIPWNKGKKWSDEVKSKVSKTKKNQVLLGIGVGKSNGNYKHGNDQRTLKRLVLIKFDYSCQCSSNCWWHEGQKCGFRDEQIVQFDHIKPKCIFPELENKEENHTALCPNCHARKTRDDHKLIAESKKRMNSGEPVTS